MSAQLIQMVNGDLIVISSIRSLAVDPSPKGPMPFYRLNVTFLDGAVVGYDYTSVALAQAALNAIAAVLGVAFSDAPAGLTLTVTATGFRLDWGVVAGASSYNVKRSVTSGSGYATVGSPTTNTYTDPFPAGGTTYHYVVTSVNGAVESGNSNEIAVKPLIPLMTADNAPSGTASASSELLSPSNDPAFQAFDNSRTTVWSADGASLPAWLQYQFASGVTAKSYHLYSSQTGGQFPTAWTLAGSNDGASWTTLDSQSGIAAIVDAIYTIASPASYSYYRLTITAMNGSYIPQTVELQLFG